MARTGEAPGWTSQFREILLDVRAELHDLRGGEAVLAPLFRDKDYGASQAAGLALKSQGSQGLVYPSVRCPGGDCVGLFYPDLARAARQGRHLDYHWDGEKVDLVRNAASGEVFRLV